MKRLFLFLAAITLVSCSSDDNNDPTPVVPTASVAYFRGSMDGTAFNYNYNGALVSSYYYGYAHSTDGSNYIDYGGVMHTAGANSSEYGLYFENMPVDDISNESDEFYDMFATPLPTNFLNSIQSDLHTKGISVFYKDAADNYFYSTYGNQNGSNVTISSVVKGIEPGTTYKTVTVTGLVNCKVYNFDLTEQHTISNGQFKLIYRQYED